MNRESKNNGDHSFNGSTLVELPSLRQKVKIQPNRFVRLSSLPSLEPRQRSLSLVSSAEKEESLTGRDMHMFRLPHLSLGAPCPVATSMKYADLVYQNWNSNSVLPSTLSGKNASKFLISGPRPCTSFLKPFRRSSKRLGKLSTHWLEHYALLANLCTFCTLETVSVLRVLSKSIYNIFSSDPFWVEVFKKMHLTPLEKYCNISAGHYNFFVNEIMTTKVLSGLYVFENMYPPSLQHSISLQTSSFSGYQMPKSSSVSGADMEELNCCTEQSKYQLIRLLITPAMLGKEKMESSRVHLLFRRWPPFDQYKAYIGSCRFSWDQKCFVFSFLDETLEQCIACTSSFKFVDEGEVLENQSLNGEQGQLVCILAVKKGFSVGFDISLFSLKKVCPPTTLEEERKSV